MSRDGDVARRKTKDSGTWNMADHFLNLIHPTDSSALLLEAGSEFSLTLMMRKDKDVVKQPPASCVCCLQIQNLIPSAFALCFKLEHWLDLNFDFFFLFFDHCHVLIVFWSVRQVRCPRSSLACPRSPVACPRRPRRLINFI